MSTRDDYTGTGSQTDFTITFDYKELNEIVAVYLNGELQIETTDYSIVGETIIRFVTAPPLSDPVVLRRESSFTTRPNGSQWNDTGAITGAAHNLEDDFSIFRDEELQDRGGLPLGLDGRQWSGFDPSNGTTRLRIMDVANPSAAQDVVTLSYLQDFVSGGQTGISGVQRAQYTGDGDTVTFNLVTAGEGQISTVDLVTCYVGERILMPSEYSVASNKIDITFDDPPGDGETIDMWVVTAAISSLEDGQILPAKITLADDNIITGNASNLGESVARSTIPVSSWGDAAAAISMGGFALTDLDDPTDDQDAATMAYVDSVVGVELSTSGGVGAYSFGTSIIENTAAHTAFYNLIQVDSASYGTTRRIEVIIDSVNTFDATPATVGRIDVHAGIKGGGSCMFTVPTGWFWKIQEADAKAMGSSTFTYQTVN